MPKNDLNNGIVREEASGKRLFVLPTINITLRRVSLDKCGIHMAEDRHLFLNAHMSRQTVGTVNWCL